MTQILEISEGNFVVCMSIMLSNLLEGVGNSFKGLIKTLDIEEIISEVENGLSQKINLIKSISIAHRNISLNLRYISQPNKSHWQKPPSLHLTSC
jgi:hypothetical protein